MSSTPGDRSASRLGPNRSGAALRHRLPLGPPGRPPALALVLGLVLFLAAPAPRGAGADPTALAPTPEASWSAAPEDPIRAVFLDLGDTVVTGKRQWVPGVREGLARLKAAGIRLGVISNTGRLSRPELLDHHLPPDFDFGEFDPELVLLSSETGLEKPDQRVFLAARDRSGLAGGEIVFLDESLAPVLAAQRAGILALRVAIVRGEDGAVARSELPELCAALARLGPGPTPTPGPAPAPAGPEPAPSAVPSVSQAPPAPRETARVP